LDAQGAKDIPAQTATGSTSSLGGSFAKAPGTALRASTSPLRAIPAAAPALTAAQPAGLVSAAATNAAFAAAPAAVDPSIGDGRRVNLGSRAAIATGGDNLLGRILTRAALAADARAAGPAGAAPAAASETSSAAAPAATPGEAAAPRTIAVSSSDPALSAFLRKFQAALNADGSTVTSAAPLQASPAPAATPLPVHAAADASLAFAPSVAPFTIGQAAGAAAPVAANAPPPADQSAIADQVLRGAFMRNLGQSSEMRLRLVPDSLGDVSVKLVVSAGTVTAHVLADTPEVRDALIAAQPQLTKSLADAGLKLTSFGVDLSGNGFAGFSQQPGGQSGGNPQRGTSSADTDNDNDETTLEAIPSFGPSLGALPNAGDYNYLA
jgi:flagellar hook-length control protein FliK